MADWPSTTVEKAISAGTVQVPYQFPGGSQQTYVPSTAIRIVVSAPTVTPTITSVLNGASFAAGGEISTGSWVTVFGTGLAPAGDSRSWNAATEISNGKFPVRLDSTSVNY